MPTNTYNALNQILLSYAPKIMGATICRSMKTLNCLADAFVSTISYNLHALRKGHQANKVPVNNSDVKCNNQSFKFEATVTQFLYHKRREGWDCVGTRASTKTGHCHVCATARHCIQHLKICALQLKELEMTVATPLRGGCSNKIWSVLSI